MQLTDSQNQVKKYVLGKYWRPIVAVFNISLSSTSLWLILLTFIFFAWKPILVKVTWKDFQEFAFWILQVGTSLRNSNSFWSLQKKTETQITHLEGILYKSYRSGFLKTHFKGTVNVFKIRRKIALALWDFTFKSCEHF